MKWFEDGDSLWDYCETKNTVNKEFADKAVQKLSSKEDENTNKETDIS